MQKCFLGIDTSCYTTSVALLDENDNLLADERIILDVERGNRGLRQSEMVFQHTKNLPVLIERLNPVLASHKLAAVAVSGKPKFSMDSYMPAFLPGLGVARAISTTARVPVFETCHQHSHIMAGLWSESVKTCGELLVLQLSGGTTEIIHAKDVFSICPHLETLGGTTDISAGQFIDRTGVSIGSNFPAGPSLEQLAKAGNIIQKFPVRLFGDNISFSGFDTKISRLVANGDHAVTDIAATVLDVVARTLIKLVQKHLREKNADTIMLVGGVAANRYIVAEFRKQIHDIGRHDLIIPSAEYCTDNAVGAAYYSRIRSAAV